MGACCLYTSRGTVHCSFIQGVHTRCRPKEAAAANRKDAKLKAVVISEAWDKKASKYNAPSVPFPYDSKSTYERSMRTPMGREFNTTATHRYGLPLCMYTCFALTTDLYRFISM